MGELPLRFFADPAALHRHVYQRHTAHRDVIRTARDHEAFHHDGTIPCDHAHDDDPRGPLLIPPHPSWPDTTPPS